MGAKVQTEELIALGLGNEYDSNSTICEPHKGYPFQLQTYIGIVSRLARTYTFPHTQHVYTVVCCTPRNGKPRNRLQTWQT